MVSVRCNGEPLGQEGGSTYMPSMFSGDLLVVTSSGQCFKIYAEPVAAGMRPGTPGQCNDGHGFT